MSFRSNTPAVVISRFSCLLSSVTRREKSCVQFYALWYLQRQAACMNSTINTSYYCLPHGSSSVLSSWGQVWFLRSLWRVRFEEYPLETGDRSGMCISQINIVCGSHRNQYKTDICFSWHRPNEQRNFEQCSTTLAEGYGTDNSWSVTDARGYAKVCVGWGHPMFVLLMANPVDLLARTRY